MAESKGGFVNPEFRLSSRSIAIVSLTLYPNWYSGGLRSIGDTDKVRGDLALQAIAEGAATGYQIVISDGGSSLPFREELSKFPGVNFVGRESKERGAGRRKVFSVASELNGVESILRAEPEKVSIFGEYAQDISAPIVKGEADIVVGKRNPKLHEKTYPFYQYKSEIDANRRYNHLLHKAGLLPKDQSLDMFFGVVAFANNPAVLALFMEKYDFILPASIGIRRYVNPENWSDGYFFSVVKALHKGLRVASVEVDFRYPENQRQNEETVDQSTIDAFIAKRAQQKWGLLDELIHFIRYLRNDQKTGLMKVTT